MEYTIERVHKYPLYMRAILNIVYLNGGKISKTKLIALLHLLSDKIKELKEGLDPEPCILVKAKRLDDFYVTIYLKKLTFDDALLRDAIDGYILTEEGQKNIYEIINDCTKEELDAIKEIVNQYGKLSENDLVDLILKRLLENNS